MSEIKANIKTISISIRVQENEHNPEVGSIGHVREILGDCNIVTESKQEIIDFFTQNRGLQLSLDLLNQNLKMIEEENLISLDFRVINEPKLSLLPD